MSNNIIEKSPNNRYFRLNESLGSGAFKNVYKAYDTQEGLEVAWNNINIDNVPETERSRITEEVKILTDCNNEYIMGLHNHWYDKEKNIVVFITEIAYSGSISKFIKKVGKIRLKVIKKWLMQILLGIKYLHSRNIIHRDIKCDNIFLNNGNILIGDFGLAKRHSQLTYSMIGTPQYMAPEIYDEKYSNSIDIYAFGMCVLELMTGESPYNECSNVTQIWKKVTKNIKPSSLKKVKNKKALNIIKKCISFKESRRPMINDLINNDFFKITENDNEFIDYSNISPSNSSNDEVEKNKIHSLDTLNSIETDA